MMASKIYSVATQHAVESTSNVKLPQAMEKLEVVCAALPTKSELNVKGAPPRLDSSWKHLHLHNPSPQLPRW